MSLSPSSHIVNILIHLCLEIAYGHVSRRIDTGFEIRVWRATETLAVELRTVMMMPQAVDDARRDDRSRCEGGENFHAETALRSGRIFMSTPLNIFEKIFMRW